MHSGGLGGGHYTAYALNESDQCWYLFNDNAVHKANESSLVTRSAYVLFYKQRSNEQ